MRLPLTYNDLQPGDLLLCYGWNAVGTLQGVVKSTHRLLRVATFPLSVPIMLATGDPVGVGKGSASCNHALVVGERLVVSHTDDPTVVPIGEHVLGTRYGIKKLDGHWQLQCTLNGVSTNRDIHDVVSQHGAPEPNPSVQQGVVNALIARSHEVEHPRVCHSTGGGCNWQYASTYFGTHTGKLAAFRLRGTGNPQARQLAMRTSQIAARWAVESGTNHTTDTRYSNWKAFWSAFHMHTYGDGAEKRARIYRTHMNTPGGPPSSNSSRAARNEKKDWFCSMFAIACYHAATADAVEAKTYLALDAKHTTPMTLDGYVRSSSQWQLVGTT